MAASFSMLKQTVSEWSEDNAPRLGAALAYYTVFSLAPLLAIAIGIAGIVLGQDAAQGRIVDSLSGMIGPQAAQTVETMIERAGRGGTGIISTIIGIVFLLFGASGVFGQLQAALNQIWEVAPQKGGGIKAFLKKRFLSVGMVLAIGFLLLVSLLVSTALSAMGGFISSRLPGGDVLWMVINNLVSLGVITLFFASVYKVLPDAEVRWRDVWVGAFVTALLFVVGKFLLGLYLGSSNVAEKFGPAGSLVIILLWIYYSAQIMFMGAEFTQVYAKRHGGIQPEAGAVKVEERRVEKDRAGNTRS